jgi:hypothetical protein
MATTPVSPDSPAMPRHTHAALIPNDQAGKTAKPVLQWPKSDPISISVKAILMNSPDYSPAEEAAENQLLSLQ